MVAVFSMGKGSKNGGKVMQKGKRQSVTKMVVSGIKSNNNEIIGIKR
jgi:hypothetical protein